MPDLIIPLHKVMVLVGTRKYLVNAENALNVVEEELLDVSGFDVDYCAFLIYQVFKSSMDAILSEGNCHRVDSIWQEFICVLDVADEVLTEDVFNYLCEELCVISTWKFKRSGCSRSRICRSKVLSSLKYAKQMYKSAKDFCEVDNSVVLMFIPIY